MSAPPPKRRPPVRGLETKGDSHRGAPGRLCGSLTHTPSLLKGLWLEFQEFMDLTAENYIFISALFKLGFSISFNHECRQQLIIILKYLWLGHQQKSHIFLSHFSETDLLKYEYAHYYFEIIIVIRHTTRTCYLMCHIHHKIKKNVDSCTSV